MKLLRLIVLLFASASFCFAQNPGLFLEAREFNFGSVDEGEVVEHSFVFYNKKRFPIKIEEVVASCGCTVAEVNPMELQSGQRGEVKVFFDTAGFYGSKSKTIQMLTSDPGQKVYEFVLRGKVRRDVEVVPGSLLLGEIIKGTSKTGQLKVQLAPGLKVQSAKTNSRSIEVSLLENNLVQVSTDAELDIGPLKSRVVIRTSSKTNPVVVVPVIGRVVGDLIADPPEVSFGLLEGPLPSPKEVKVRVINRGGGSISVLKAKSESDALNIEVERFENGKIHFLTIALEEGFLGSLNSTIEVETDHPDKEQSKLSIPIAAIVVKRQ